jgi:voltage-gated potassium channel Kch
VFNWRARGIGEPFYVLCGYGQSGARLARALDRMGNRLVILEPAADRAARIAIQDFASPPLVLPADARLAARYERWAAALLDESPDTCLRATLDDGRTVGWFLAAPRGGSLELTLAALHRDASVSGARLYEACLAAFAARGHRLGHASFSAENTSVHNVYASLGARFVAPEHIWRWTADTI